MNEINWQPGKRDLQIFAILWICFFSLISGIVYNQTSSSTSAIIIVSAATLIALTGLAMPKFMRIIYLGWMIAVYPIGWFISHAAMATVYYLVLTPIGLMLRFLGRDLMQKRFDHTASTYWQKREKPSPPQRYFRQF